jgi:hypothetical protein
LEFLILPKITGNIPLAPLDTKAWTIPTDKPLADPHFNTPQQIDMLIGAEIFFEVWTNQQFQLQKGAMLQGTVFGWIIAGKVPTTQGMAHALSTFCGCVAHSDTDLFNQVKRFWEVESCSSAKVLSVQEKQVEQHFLETHQRQPDGRYVLRLPTKANVNKLGDSKQAALRRFLYLEKKLSRDPDLKQQYSAFIQEYIDLGHMKLSEPATEPDASNEYFLPHHAIIKPDSSTTKLRVVFDASAKSSTGLSLNDVIKVGATIQQELFEILLRFRKYQYAFTSDIGKMYRQVLIHEDHHKLQQILWRNDPFQEISAFSLKTVTYGTASAPFLATRALQQLAEDEQSKFPIAAITTKNDFYVDDVLSGANSLPEALELQSQLINLLKLGGFELHKWCANTPALLSNVPHDRREKKLELNDNQTVELPEMKSLTVIHEQLNENFPVIAKFSSLPKLQRVMGYVNRFVNNIRRVNVIRCPYLTAEELTNSLTTVIKVVQREEFPNEFAALKKGNYLSNKSNLVSLNAFLDDQSIIRVGGRLSQSNLSFDTKHQIMLPKRHHFTTTLLRHLHEQHGHVGQQALVSIVRQKYWPVGAKDVARSVVKACVKCFRCRPTSTEQHMGDLPAVRTTGCCPFLNTGVDYTGVLTLKLTRRTTVKAYVAIFVCMATKAVHIELVTELSSKAFLAALDRYISRRGHCRNLYSDNGTNFVGANTELSAL